MSSHGNGVFFDCHRLSGWFSVHLAMEQWEAEVCSLPGFRRESSWRLGMAVGYPHHALKLAFNLGELYSHAQSSRRFYRLDHFRAGLGSGLGSTNWKLSQPWFPKSCGTGVVQKELSPLQVFQVVDSQCERRQPESNKRSGEVWGGSTSSRNEHNTWIGM